MTCFALCTDQHEEEQRATIIRTFAAVASIQREPQARLPSRLRDSFCAALRALASSKRQSPRSAVAAYITSLAPLNTRLRSPDCHKKPFQAAAAAACGCECPPLNVGGACP